MELRNPPKIAACCATAARRGHFFKGAPEPKVAREGDDQTPGRK